MGTARAFGRGACRSDRRLGTRALPSACGATRHPGFPGSRRTLRQRTWSHQIDAIYERPSQRPCWGGIWVTAAAAISSGWRSGLDRRLDGLTAIHHTVAVDLGDAIEAPLDSAFQHVSL